MNTSPEMTLAKRMLSNSFKAQKPAEAKANVLKSKKQPVATNDCKNGVTDCKNGVTAPEWPNITLRDCKGPNSTPKKNGCIKSNYT